MKKPKILYHGSPKKLTEKKVDLKKIFGSLKLKEPTQKLKDEMRAGWEP